MESFQTPTRSPAPDPEALRSRLREHGVRPTRQRELVYAALASTDTHPTAEELLTAVRAADPSVSQATVYNTLDALTGSGLARRLPARAAGGACRYDADLRPHVHLTLPDGRVVDAPEGVSKTILDALRTPGLDAMGLTPDRVSGVHIDLQAE
ncbi:MAG: transcriptional repressor [Phycisphaerales bacterium]|nr:transcriptional repressor [Phycisphaerales bacterium]